MGNETSLDLYFFLMILLSIIIGLGVTEILSGFASVLRSEKLREFCLPHAATVLTLFIALLQYFWETWSLRMIEEWTFPALTLMLIAPILLYLIAHLLFPDQPAGINLTDYYYEKASLIWTLACLTILAGVLFRPLAFDMPLLVRDNLSSAINLAAAIALALSSNRWLHRILVPVGALLVILDTLVISYFISQ